MRSGSFLDDAESEVPPDRVRKLEELTSALRKENIQLRSQFEKALELANQIDSVTEKNIALGNQLRAAKAQNAELEQRLEILAKSNEDLDRQLNKERDNSTAMRRLDGAAKEKELAKITARTNAQIKNITDDLEAMTEAKERLDSECKRYLTAENSVLTCAAQYFECTFENISELTDYLQANMAEHLREIHEPPEPTGPGEEVLELEEEIRQLKLERETAAGQHRKESEGLRRELDEVRRDAELSVIEQKRRVSVLEGQVQGLEEELSRVSCEARKAAVAAEVEHLSRDLAAVNEKNSTLQVQVRKLEGQLTSLTHSSGHERTTGQHREERLKAQIQELELRIESQEAQLRSEGEKLRGLNDRKERTEKTIRAFLGHACSVLGVRPLSVEEFLSARGVETINSALSELRSTADQGKRRSADLAKVIDQFRESFQLEEGVEASTIVALITDLRAKLDRQHGIILKGRKRCEQLKARLLEVEQALEASTAESADLSEQLTNACARHNESLAAINEKDALLRDLDTQIHQIRGTLAQRESEVESLKQDQTASEKRISDEREEYESAIQRMRNQSEALRGELQDAHSQLQTAERESKGLQQHVAELELQIETMERETNGKVDQLVREKKLAEAEARSRIKTAESDFASKLDEARTNWEHQERRLIGFVLDQFREFFSRKGAIDEETLRDVVHGVKNEFRRLKKSDDRIRTVLRATSAQKTDEAVALMLSDAENR